jgi:hypothetical protein
MRRELAALFACLALPVSAADIGFLPAPHETVLMLSGEIVKGDDDKVRALLSQRPVRKLVLDSPGGDYYAALGIAHQVYMHGIATIAPIEGQCDEAPDQSCLCASSCVFVWAAGRPRFGNMLVIHAPFTDELKGKDALTRANGETAIKAHVQTMLRKLDVPETIIQAVVDTPPQSPRRLTEDELETLEPFSYVPPRELPMAKAPN